MPTSDSIADMLTRIRNANRNGVNEVRIPKSGVCVGIAQVLKDEGYINDFDSIDDGPQGQLRVQLKYGERGEKVIQHLQRASKPGRRLYCGSKEIPRPLDGLGIVVISTSQGVMSDRAARQKRLGGELLCTVW